MPVYVIALTRNGIQAAVQRNQSLTAGRIVVRAKSVMAARKMIAAALPAPQASLWIDSGFSQAEELRMEGPDAVVCIQSFTIERTVKDGKEKSPANETGAVQSGQGTGTGRGNEERRGQGTLAKGG